MCFSHMSSLEAMRLNLIPYCMSPDPDLHPLLPIIFNKMPKTSKCPLKPVFPPNRMNIHTL